MQEAFVKQWNGVFAFQCEIGGQNRSAGYADDDIDVGQQGFSFAADGYLLLVELFQNAVTQRRRTRSSA